MTESIESAFLRLDYAQNLFHVAGWRQLVQLGVSGSFELIHSLLPQVTNVTLGAVGIDATHVRCCLSSGY